MRVLYWATRFLAITWVCIWFLVLNQAELLFAKNDTKKQIPWSYSIQKGIEKSSRSYLFVHRPQETQERRITVVSECQKEVHAEGVYGKCKHTVSISPTGKNFTLHTGEDVVMIQTAWDSPLVLGTINYGCCAEDVTITFYTEDSSRLGMLQKTPGMMQSALYGTTITRALDLGNSTGRHEKQQFFVVEADNNEVAFCAWEKNKTGGLKKVPILLQEDETHICGKWFLSEFVKYGDRDDITLILEGISCNENTEADTKCNALDKRYFSCHEGKNAIECKEKP